MSEQEYIAIANFREKLKQYGLSDASDKLLEAIMMSYLTNGRLQKNLPESDALVLRQLEIGWPILTDMGKNIAREQIALVAKVNEQKLESILEVQSPRVVALFLGSATQENDIHYLRFNEDPHNDDYFMRGEISFPELITHPKLHQSIIKIGDELMKAGLGVKYTDLPYRNAKWVAVFIHFPQSVAEKISRWLSERGVTLSECESQLKLYAMLRSSPIPTLADFGSQGIDKYKLETIAGSVLKQGAITPIIDIEGPAFLVLNEALYKRAVLQPVFNYLVELLIERNKTPVPSPVEEKTGCVGKTQQSHDKTASKEDIIIGCKEKPGQWGVIGLCGGKKVLMDLNAPRIIFVCGKMGSGKGYAIGVLCEMLTSESVSGICNMAKPATVIVLYNPREDKKSEFWSIKTPNDVSSEVERLRDLYGVSLLSGIDDRKFRIFVDPFIYDKAADLFKVDYDTQNVFPIYVDPSSLTGKEWAIALSAGGKTDQQYVKRLFSIIEKRQFEPFDLDTIKSDVIEDENLNATQQKLASQRLEILQNYLRIKTGAKDFVENLAIGGVNIFDFRKTIRTPDDVFSVMTLILSVLQTKKGLEDEPFIFVINEAHDYFKGSVADEFIESIEYLIRRKRHCGNWLILDTHFPDDVDDKVIQLADIKMVNFLDITVNSKILNSAFKDSSVKFSELSVGQTMISADESSLGKFVPVLVNVRPRLTRHGAATKVAKGTF